MVMRVLQFFAENRAILLYCERWLKASVQIPDGTSQSVTEGTSQGGVISPLLANLFLHRVKG